MPPKDYSDIPNTSSLHDDIVEESNHDDEEDPSQHCPQEPTLRLGGERKPPAPQNIVVPRAPAKLNKSVRFLETCRLKKTRFPTLQDRKNAWYSRADFHRFRCENEEMVNDACRSAPWGMINSRSLSSTTLQDTKEDTLLGLGYLFPEQIEVRKIRRQAVWDLVLELQHVMDPEQLGHFCSRLTDNSRLESQREALILETTLWAANIGALLEQDNQYQTSISLSTKAQDLSFQQTLSKVKVCGGQ